MGQSAHGKKPRLTYFAPCDPRQGMGGGARVEQMLTALEAIGYDITIVSYDGSGALGLTLESVSKTTKIIKLAIPHGLPKLVKTLALPGLVLLGLLSTKTRDLVITHSPGVASGLIGFVVARLRRGHFVVDLTDVNDSDTPLFIYEGVLKSACIVFAVSHQLERLARGVGAAAVTYLPTFLDLSRYPLDHIDKIETRRSLGLTPQEKVIGYFGSFASVEGLPILLKAFRMLSEDLPQAKLLIVGSRNVTGSDDVAGMIKNLALGGRVIQLPPQPYLEVPRLLRAADLLVAPKIRARENEVADPIKIYEYLASGIPCILSGIGEVAVTAGDAAAAFVVEPGNARALSQMITRVFASQTEAAACAARGRQLIESRYSIEGASRLVRLTFSNHGIGQPVVRAHNIQAATAIRRPGQSASEKDPETLLPSEGGKDA